jgi:hypothetical protein
VPGFSVGTGTSIFGILRQLEEGFDVTSWIINLRLYEQTNVISFIVLQSGAVGFFLTLNLFSEGFLNAFRYNLVLQHFRKLNHFPYLKDHGDLFEFGYYYAYNTVIIYLVFVFGIYKPLIVLAGAVYFGLKSVANLVSQTHYYGQQFDSGTVLPNAFLNRAKFCIPTLFLLLSLKCLVSDLSVYFVLHFAAFVTTTIFNLRSYIRCFVFQSLFSLNHFRDFGLLIRTTLRFPGQPLPRHHQKHFLQVLPGPGYGGPPHRGRRVGSQLTNPLFNRHP